MYHTRDITKFQTLHRIQSIPTLSRVLFYRGIDESRDRFKHFMQSEPRGKVGSFFDIKRISTTLSEARNYKRFNLECDQKEVIYVFLFGMLTGAES